MSEELLLVISMIITGGLAYKTINAIKKVINPTGVIVPIKLGDFILYLDLNLLISMGICTVLSVFALLITGAFSKPMTPVGLVGLVCMAFTIATNIYKSLKKPDTP